MAPTVIVKDSEVEQKFKFLQEQFKGYNSFVHTWLYDKFVHCPYKILFWDTGNKHGKTYVIARNYVERILGEHPIARKNVLYFKCDNQTEYHEFSPIEIRNMYPHTGQLVRLNSDDKASPDIPDEECPKCGATLHEVERYDRIFRFSSGSLPSQGEDTYHKRNRGAMARNQSLEVRNVQHPAFTKLLPPFLLAKDCTTRVAAQTIIDPYQRGPIMVEYTSYVQPLVAKTGASRLSIWPDEKMPEEEYADAKARVVLEKGDIVLSCTPIEDVSYTFYYNDIYEKAMTFYRTHLLCKRMEEKYGRKYNRIEYTDSKQSIAVFCGTSYDNPVIDKNEVDALLTTGDSQDTIDVKIYGLMLKLSGRIFANFDQSVHLYEDGVFDAFKEERMAV